MTGPGTGQACRLPPSPFAVAALYRVGRCEDTGEAISRPQIPPPDRRCRVSDLVLAEETAEQIVIGACLIKPAMADELRRIVRPEDFSVPRYAAMFTAICDLTDALDEVNEITVSRESKADRMAVFECRQAVPTIFNAPWYAAEVAKCGQLRRISMLGAQAKQRTESEDPADVIASIREGLDSIELRTQHAWLAGGQAYERLVESTERRGSLIPTGLGDLDRALGGGLKAGYMTVVGALPGVGKSTLLTGILRHTVFVRGEPGLFLSLEMNAGDVMVRIASAHLHIPLLPLLTASAPDHDLARVAEFGIECETAPLAVKDTPNMTLADIRSVAREVRSTFGRLGVLVVDYLQLIEPAGRQVESRQVEVARLSRGLALLARELDCVLVVAAQLNREPTRTSRRPRMSDLRESGAIAADAETVILLHREDSLDVGAPPTGEIELIIDKHRPGVRGLVTCAFQGEFSRIVDIYRPPSGATYP